MLEYGKRKGSAMNIEIAQRLYELRRKHGFSQESLAATLGLSRQAISKWERSESAPDMGNLIALADLYDMTIDELIRPCNESTKSDESKIAEGETLEIKEVEEVEEIADIDAALEDEDIVEAAEVCETCDSVEVAETIETAQTVDTTVSKAAEAPTETARPTDVAATKKTTPDVKQVVAHGHIYTRPASPVRPRCKLRRIPYPLIVTIIFLVLGILVSFWEYLWLFITIPFYYWIARIIERDPKFLAEHGFNADGSYNSVGSSGANNVAKSSAGTVTETATETAAGTVTETITETTSIKEAE